MRYEASGTFHYGPGVKAIISVEQSISNYYRSLIPKYVNVNPQMHPAHITVVRIGLECPIDREWGKHEGEKVCFAYDSNVQFDGTYFYLNVHCDKIGDIREELGLPRYRFDDNKKYHITIGNVKP